MVIGRYTSILILLFRQKQKLSSLQNPLIPTLLFIWKDCSLTQGIMYERSHMPHGSGNLKFLTTLAMFVKTRFMYMEKLKSLQQKTVTMNKKLTTACSFRSKSFFVCAIIVALIGFVSCNKNTDTYKDDSIGGEYGSLSWNLIEGTLTVSGVGAMQNGEVPWGRIKGKSKR
jgi:hypothetical protein